MNLQYSPVFNCPPETAIHCRWILYFTQLELFSMLLEVLWFMIVIYATLKSPFHFNLTLIGIYMLLGYYVFLIGRFITCLYEIGVFTFTAEEKSDEYPLILVISSILQFYYMGCACGISLAIVLERSFATYFVDTYEKDKRRWISVFICSEYTVACTFSAFIMLCDYFPISVMTFIGVCISCISFASYLLLFMMNRKRLRRIQEERDNNKYSLSVRFQISENLKLMTLLRNVVIFSGVNNLIMGIILAVYTSKSFKTKYPILTLYLHFTFNLCVLLYSYLIPIIMMFSVKQFRVYFLSLRYIRPILYPVFGRCFPHEFNVITPVENMTIIAETDFYFSNLSTQWDRNFEKRQSR